MISGLLGKKIGMTQIFNQEGFLIPVTVIEIEPNTILELKEGNKTKVVVGYENIKESRANKPQLGYFKKVNVTPKRKIKEFKSSDNAEYTVGQELTADVFKAGDYVDVAGISIGKGFAGGMKRWGWHGGPGGHGSHHHRRAGSIGQCATPSRVFRGFHMPGQMGNKRCTTQNLRVMEVDLENNYILVKGAVPGHKNGYVEVNKSFKREWRDLNDVRENVVKSRNPMKQSKAKAGKK